MSWEIVPFESLKGKTFKNIIINKTNDSISFITDDNKWYIMNHKQECCESVYLKEIDNDISLLVGSEILLAEHRTNESDIQPGDELYNDYNYTSQTWSFYTLRTMSSTCTISWHGASNGYYSEEVDLKLYVDERQNQTQKISEYIISYQASFDKYENQLIDYFLEIIKSIPVEIHWYTINWYPKCQNVSRIKNIHFSILNPKSDLIEYKLYFDEQKSIKIDRIIHFDDLSIEKIVNKDITWPDVEFIEEFLYRYGRFE